MKFKAGRYRFVFVFPFLGVAIKFPVIHGWRVFLSFVRNMWHCQFNVIRVEMSLPANPAECHAFAGYKNLLFGGIVTNWTEFCFFWRNRNPFCQPTYFSFFGLFNIQKAGVICTTKGDVLRDRLYQITNGKTMDDPHHFANPDNFCMHNGKLRIVDYGDTATHTVIKEYGKVISETFGNEGAY